MQMQERQELEFVKFNYKIKYIQKLHKNVSKTDVFLVEMQEKAGVMKSFNDIMRKM